ncbi:Cation efflux protein [Carpediemonas membranifera]|uniref:Cation efflux protein n=1 Tax=Carpediemonas membranifera TaxID=201153 RepID=A0A8J6B777_9EUKA|nr:Cation efflux protein [Carpediemonas membranifera]|eukprot:KAG9391422.1 Cation efflux protein [Carpediemonas membranifera]
MENRTAPQSRKMSSDLVEFVRIPGCGSCDSKTAPVSRKGSGDLSEFVRRPGYGGSMADMSDVITPEDSDGHGRDDEEYFTAASTVSMSEECDDMDCLCHSIPLSHEVHEEYKRLKSSKLAIGGLGAHHGSWLWRIVDLMRRYRLKKYYRVQNEQIEAFLEAYAVIQAANHDKPLEDLPLFPSEPSSLLGTLAVTLSFIANVILVVVKIIAVYLSGSMAVYASMLDSILDVVSGFVLSLTTVFAKRGNRLKYPMGRSRWVSVGIIMFATIMASFSLTLIRDNIVVLTVDREQFKADLDFELPPIFIMLGTIATKLFLAVFCRFVGRTDSARAYAQDHINDVFTNACGLVLGLLGYHLFWAIDPLGSTVMASVIIIIWVSNAYQQIINLVGKSGPDMLNSKLTFLAMHHDPRILRVDFVETFHFGDNYIVEIHIVLDPATKLSESHDVEESLKWTLETMPNIDRAFVHVDFDGGPQPINEHKVLVHGGR